MIGFSIMMWFCSLILLFLGITLRKGNYSCIHGKVFENTTDKENYAKSLSGMVVFLAMGIAISGLIALILPNQYAIITAVSIMLIIIIIAIFWSIKIQKKFSKI